MSGTNITKLSFFLLRLLVLVMAIWFVYHKLSGTNGAEQLLNDFLGLMQTEGFYLVILLLVFLGFLNRIFEAWKWKVMLIKVQRISIRESWKGVLTGIAIGFVTPARVGEIAGRWWFLKKENFWKATGVLISSGIIQVLSILICSSLLLLLVFFIPENDFPELSGLIIFYWIVSLPVLFLVLLLVFYHQYFRKLVHKLPFLKKFREQKQIEIWDFTQREFSFFLFISSLRYFIFVLQYFILMVYFEVHPNPVLLIVFIAFLLLALTFIPAGFFGKVGVREAITLGVFQFFDHTEQLIFISLLIWFVNQALPALSGSVFLLQNRKGNG